MELLPEIDLLKLTSIHKLKGFLKKLKRRKMLLTFLMVDVCGCDWCLLRRASICGSQRPAC
jgi:hypothetical protein